MPYLLLLDQIRAGKAERRLIVMKMGLPTVAKRARAGSTTRSQLRIAEFLGKIRFTYAVYSSLSRKSEHRGLRQIWK